jgi:hypothetical protein
MQIRFQPEAEAELVIKPACGLREHTATLAAFQKLKIV